MAIIIECPACQKTLKMGDASIGKRVRCPGCKHQFVAPGKVDEPEEEDDDDTPTLEHAPDEPEEYAVEKPKRSAKRSRRDRDDEDNGPWQPRRGSLRKKERPPDYVGPTILPLIWGVVSVIFGFMSVGGIVLIASAPPTSSICCIFGSGPVGIVSGLLAFFRADRADVPDGPGYLWGERRLLFAKILGVIGIGFSFITACIVMLAILTNHTH